MSGDLDAALTVLAGDPALLDDPAGLAAAGIAVSGAGGLQVVGDRVVVTVHVDGPVPDATVTALRAVAAVESVAVELGVVTALVPVTGLAGVAALPGVVAVSAARAPARR